MGAGVRGAGALDVGVRGAGVRSAGVKEGGGRGETCRQSCLHSSAHGPEAAGRHSPSADPLVSAQDNDGLLLRFTGFPQDYKVMSVIHTSWCQ